MLIIGFRTHRLTECIHVFTKCSKSSTCRRLWLCGVYHRQKHETKGPWNVLFFGSDDFAVESLRSLYNEQSSTLGRLEVVTAQKGKENAIAQYAKKHGIAINTWPLQEVTRGFDIGVVVSFGHLIPSHIISSFPLGMINVHASLLPRWRGAAPIIYSLMNGDVQTGITIMKIMPKKFDIGDIVAQEQTDIHQDETLPELHARLAKLGADLLIQTMRKLPFILSTAKPQSETGVTYAPKITSQTSLVKWNEMTAKNVYDLQRALTGVHPLTTKFHDKIIKLLDVKPVEQSFTAVMTEHQTPGTVVYSWRKKLLFVKCKDESWISVKTVIVPGRAPMRASDFNNGFIAGQKRATVMFQ